MSDLELTRDDATILLMQKAVLDRLQELNNEARAEAAKRMEVGQVTPGLRAENGLLGKVRLDRGSGGPRKAKIVDRAAFTEWVIEHHGDVGYEAARTVTTLVPGAVRPAYEAAILARVKKDGGLVDDDGVVEEVPGVELVDVDPVLKVLVDDDIIGPYVTELLRTAGLDRTQEIATGEPT